MARMPAALWVGEQSPRTPMSRYDIVCVHTIVGFAPAHAAHFSVRAGGQILQSRDTLYRSAANLDGNHRVIAVECEDHGDAFPAWDGSDVPPLTDAQVASIGQILAWAHTVHGVPLELCPDSRPASRGLAYHRQGIDGNFGTFDFPGRVPGGEVWTEWVGKVCPGDNRIHQLPAILAAALGEEPDVGVQLDDDIYRDDREVSVRGVLQRLDTFLGNQAEHRKALRAQIAEAVAEARDADADAQAKLDRVLRRLERLRDLVDDDEVTPATG